jgi:histidyl-tRNA synthetase
VSPGFQAPKGTFDVLPDEAVRRARIEEIAGTILERAGYGRIETPIFEDTELFERGVGRSTDIVNKEMFTFEDKGGRSITLRPEVTAPLCRAYVEHGMHKLAQPVKLWTSGPFFRHERPQAGRFRQFTQIDAEAIGSDDPLADVEIIRLLADLLDELGVPGVELRLASLGSIEARARYLETLKGYLHEHEAELSKEVRERIDINPLRAFDSDHEGTRAAMAEAPKLLDHLDEDDAEHFARVRSLLDETGVAYALDPSLVRGIDYYTRTIFSFVCDRLGAQSEVGGGGRYDGLVEQLGGPATPAIGWAVGVERLLLALDDEEVEQARDVFIAAADDGQRERAMAIAIELRGAGISAETDLAGRSLKGQLKQADRIGAQRTLILEAGGAAQLRDMRSGEQEAIDAAEAVARLRNGGGSET